jgi:glycosyltransferase involved in cell wall biosynthesis
MKLSVLMIAYNQEDYIAQALDSILAQDVNFDYEVVIGEDGSTDNTRNILLEYQQKHPDKIRLLLRPQNLGMMKNFTDTYRRCTGEYIAILEGDDYWLCKDKLQVQADLLDENPDVSACFTTVKAVYENNSGESFDMPSEAYRADRFDFKDIVGFNFIPTCSVMFRNNYTAGLPAWFEELPIGDYPLHILNAQYGKIAYVDSLMAVYRLHQASSFSSQSKCANIEKLIAMYNSLKKQMDEDYSKFFDSALSFQYVRLSYEYLMENRVDEFRQSIKGFKSHFKVRHLLMHKHLLSSLCKLIVLWGVKIKRVSAFHAG